MRSARGGGPARRAASGRRAATGCAAVAIAAAIACAHGPLPAEARAPAAARAARSLSVKDEGNLRLIRSSGSTLTDEGPTTGTIPGRVRVLFVYNGNPNVSAQITIYGHSGSIRAHGSGRLSSPTSPNPSFSGNLTIAGGSGRYAHARGSGHLYGVFHRRSYGMIVQTQGTLRY
jgi:hypothetical protein